MGYFPLFTEIEGKKAVIAGGGRVAARKAEKLLGFGAELYIIAPKINGEIEDLAKTGGAALIYREVMAEDLADAVMVIAATDREAVNAWIAEWCKERKIPVNVVDDREKCSFFFPALVTDGPLTVGISTDGNSPAAASFLRRQIEGMLPDGLGPTLEILGKIRKEVMEVQKDQRQRADCLEKLFYFCKNRGFLAGEEEIREYLKSIGKGKEQGWKH